MVSWRTVGVAALVCSNLVMASMLMMAPSPALAESTSELSCPNYYARDVDFLPSRPGRYEDLWSVQFRLHTYPILPRTAFLGAEVQNGTASCRYSLGPSEAFTRLGLGDMVPQGDVVLRSAPELTCTWAGQECALNEAPGKNPADCRFTCTPSTP